MRRLLELPEFSDYLIQSADVVAAELDNLARRQTYLQVMDGHRPSYRTEIIRRKGLRGFSIAAPHDPALKARIEYESVHLWLVTLTASVPCQIAADTASLSGSELWLQWPRAFLRLQRRDTFRIRPQSPYVATLRPTFTPLAAYTLYDISAQGLSVAFPKGVDPDTVVYPNAAMRGQAFIAQLELLDHGKLRVIDVRVEPLYTARLEDGCNKMGCRIDRISPSDEAALRQFIMGMDRHMSAQRSALLA